MGNNSSSVVREGTSSPFETTQQSSLGRGRRRGAAVPVRLREGYEFSPRGWPRRDPDRLLLYRRATAAMFESAHNTRIHGGSFTAQHGPQATLTVNINNVPTRHSSEIHQANHLEQHVTAGLSRGLLKDAQSEEDSKRHNSRPPRMETYQNRPLPSLPPLEVETRPVQKYNEIYEQHLRQKGRGHPLWIPQPNICLPTSYRVKGVCIGDVGIITPDGSFDFLFNICLPTTDPIHSDELPEGFTPLCPPLGRRDVREFREFTNGSYLASSAVSKVHLNPTQSRVMAFESSASEGAILTMPEGAYKEELNNISKFRNYVAVHAENWYKFVNGYCGREAQNGDLRVVVGCDKTTFWGMATFHNLFPQNNFRLHCVSRHDENGKILPGEKYSWEHSGTAEVRVGPGVGENDELASEMTQLPLRNQCLFLRTLTVTLSGTLWQDLHRRLALDLSQNSSSISTTITSPSSPHTSQQPRTATHQASSYLTRSSQHNRPLPSSFVAATEPRGNMDVIVAYSFASSAIAHPSKIINDLLLQEKPEAKIAIITDRDCYSISSPEASMLSDPTHLIAKLREARDICVSDGVIYLEPKELDLRNIPPEMVSPVNKLIDGSISVKEYLFGSTGVSFDRLGVLERFQSRLLEGYVVDGRVTLREYVEKHARTLRNSGIGETLEGLLKQTYSGSIEVNARPTTDVNSLGLHLAGHPRRLLSLDDVFRSITTSEANSFPIQLSPSEPIRNLRDRLSTYCSSTVVESQVPYLLKLANSLFNRFIQIQERDDLDEAICYYREASISVNLVASYRHVEALLGLSSSLYQRLLLSGRFEDLVDLVKCLQAQAALNLAASFPEESISSGNVMWQGSTIISEHNYMGGKFNLPLFAGSNPNPTLPIPSGLTKLIIKQSQEANLIFLSKVPTMDIKRYLVDCFRKVREAHPMRATMPLSKQWPEDNQINMLVKASSGSFVYPITVMRYVSSPRHIPTDRLLAVLTHTLTSSGRLNKLYSMIINETQNLEAIRLLGFVFFGREETIKPKVLEEYLFLKEGDVRRLTLDLDSFMEYVDEETPIRFWHPASLYKFIRDLIAMGQYLSLESIQKESLHLCIKHLKRFQDSGYDPMVNSSPAVEYSVNNMIKHLRNALKPQAESLISEIYDTPYIECLSKWIPGTECVYRSDSLLYEFLKCLEGLSSRSDSTQGELYIHHQRIWDQDIRDRLSKLPMDFGLAFCITLVATQWSLVNPLDTLKHISAINPSQNYEDIYPCGIYLYCWRESLSRPRGWLPDENYRELLLDFLFTSSRAGPYYLDQSKFILVAKSLIDFIIRPWDDGKRSIRDFKSWENILLAFSQILKHIGYNKELIDVLCQPKFMFRLPFVEESKLEMVKCIRTVIVGIEEYARRNGGGNSPDEVRVLIRDEVERTVAELSLLSMVSNAP